MNRSSAFDWSIPGGTGISPQMPMRVQKKILTFEEVFILHGDTCSLRINLHFLFRPIRLIIDPDCASFFEVQKIEIGKNSYLDGPLPATFFPPYPEDEKVACVELMTFLSYQPGITIHLQVRHRDSCEWHTDCIENTDLGRACSNRPFRAAFHGLVLE